MELTERQKAARTMVASAIVVFSMLFGGSRSGKTFFYVWAVVTRALKAPGSRHAILRFRFNHVKSSIVADTFPKMMQLAFPSVTYHLDRTDWYVTLPNGSEIWFGGLDDKARTEKILGQEYATIYLNECSQIAWSAAQMAYTRLAQKVAQFDGTMLPLRVFHDCNPPSKAHWTYKLFVQKRDPDTGELLKDPEKYDSMRVNPVDNTDNIPPEYLDLLKNMGARMRQRFFDGIFADANPSQLFSEDMIESLRLTEFEKLPEMVRIAVAVDPSGADDDNNEGNDAIGIVVAGLGIDGNAYVLGDATVKAGPAVWGRIAVEQYLEFKASVLVGETNFGGAMVKAVIATAARALDSRVAYKTVTASRGKVVRAEPIAALYEQGKVRHYGYYPELEDELYQFSTSGYVGERSPNRADALVWSLSELFPSLVRQAPAKSGDPVKKRHTGLIGSGLGWLGS